MGELKKWVDQDWVRIGTDGKIKGKCGTSKDKKNPDRCLPRSKAQAFQKKKEPQPLVKKREKAVKEKPSSKTRKARK